MPSLPTFDGVVPAGQDYHTPPFAPNQHPDTENLCTNAHCMSMIIISIQSTTEIFRTSTSRLPQPHRLVHSTRSNCFQYVASFLSARSLSGYIQAQDSLGGGTMDRTLGHWHLDVDPEQIWGRGDLQSRP